MNKHDQDFLVQKIRTQYAEKEHIQLDALKKLDAKVKRPAKVLAYLLGVVGAIVLGCGMSLVMTDIGATLGIANTMAPGIVVGIVGLVLVVVNYPIFQGFLSSRRKKYADEIMALSDKLLDRQ